MSSFLKTTKADTKLARNVLKHSKTVLSQAEKIKIMKDKIWKRREMKKHNPLPMKSTRAQREEEAKRVPVCEILLLSFYFDHQKELLLIKINSKKFIHPNLVLNSVEEDTKFRHNPKQKEWPELHKRIANLEGTNFYVK